MWGAVGQTPPPTGPAGQGLLQDMARRTAADMGTPNAFGLMPGQAVMGGGNNTNPNADPYNSNYNPNGNNGVAQGTDAYNQNLQDARSRAMNDRAQAVGAQNRVPTSLLSQNPYGPQFQAQTQGILQDARARQYNTAVEDLRQMYAQMGRPLDPRMIATLRMQQARDQNADLTNLQTQTAGAGFQATAQYVSAMQQNANSLNNVLGNTNYLPGTQDLALLLSMAKAGGQNGGQGASGGGAGAPSPSGQGDMPALSPAPAGNWAGNDAATAFYNTGDGGMQESPEEQMS